jgi:hypothetical protein
VSKHDPIEQALNRLAALKSATADAVFLAELRGYISNPSNLVVAEAAKLWGQRRIADLVPDLAGAFYKLMADAARLAIRQHRYVAMGQDVARLNIKNVQHNFDLVRQRGKGIGEITEA